MIANPQDYIIPTSASLFLAPMKNVAI